MSNNNELNYLNDLNDLNYSNIIIKKDSSKNYFMNDFHKLAYEINRTQVVEKIRIDLKICDKYLSIGEIDKNVCATLLYQGNISIDNIPKKLLKPLNIEEICKWLSKIYLTDNNETTNIEYL